MDGMVGVKSIFTEASLPLCFGLNWLEADYTRAVVACGSSSGIGFNCNGSFPASSSDFSLERGVRNSFPAKILPAEPFEICEGDMLADLTIDLELVALASSSSDMPRLSDCSLSSSSSSLSLSKRTSSDSRRCVKSVVTASLSSLSFSCFDVQSLNYAFKRPIADSYAHLTSLMAVEFISWCVRLYWMCSWSKLPMRIES